MVFITRKFISSIDNNWSLFISASYIANKIYMDMFSVEEVHGVGRTSALFTDQGGGDYTLIRSLHRSFLMLQ